MSVDILVKYNEKYKNKRPVSSLIYLIEDGCDFVDSLDENVYVPYNCPSKLLKKSLTLGVSELLRTFTPDMYTYIEDSGLTENEDFERVLKVMKNFYLEDRIITGSLCEAKLLADLVLYIIKLDDKDETVIRNVIYLLSMHETDIRAVIERIFHLNEHDREFLKEPLLCEVKCKNADDLLDKLSDLTKERFIIINQYDKKCELSATRPPYIWEISRRAWKSLLEQVEDASLDLKHFRNLTVVQIDKFLTNFEQAVPELKELCKKDSLAITCVINDFKYQDFVLNSYTEYQEAMRNSIVSYALANDKVRFMQLITNRADLLHANREATKILMQEKVYTECLDINTMRVDDFLFLGKWTIEKWTGYKDIDVMLDMPEFSAIVGASDNYVHFMCTAKKQNLVNLDAYMELKEEHLLPKSLRKVEKLVQELNGRKLSEVHSEYFNGTDIGYRMLIKLICLCGLEEAKKVRTLWEAYLVTEVYDGVDCAPLINLEELIEMKKQIVDQSSVGELIKEFPEHVDDMILKGVADVCSTFDSSELNKDVSDYFDYVLREWFQDSLYDKLYSPDSFRYEIEQEILQEEMDLWRQNLKHHSHNFVAEEISTFEEKMMLHRKLNTGCSYKQDRSVCLSVMDATKKLIAVYHCGDCIGIATLRMTKIGEPFSRDTFLHNEIALYLSDITFASDISLDIKRDATKCLFVLAMQKSCSLNYVLLLARSYLDKDLDISLQKATLKIFNNKSRNPIQYFEDNYYRCSWDAKQEYYKSTIGYIK